MELQVQISDCPVSCKPLQTKKISVRFSYVSASGQVSNYLACSSMESSILN